MEKKGIEKKGLVIKDVQKIYHSKAGDVEALHNINLHVHPKEFISLLGTSGCGKSTIASDHWWT